MTQPNASNRHDIRIAEKAAAVREAQKLEFLIHTMSTTGGRLFWFDFLADCGVGHIQPCFEPNRDYFDLGQRNVGLRYQALMQSHCPDQYIQMIREDHVRSTATERSRSTNSGRNPEGRVELGIGYADHDQPGNLDDALDPSFDFDPYATGGHDA